MYNQNSLATGAKWFFFLAIVILIGAFALGLNIKDATWLNGEIASATAQQMNLTTDIQRQKAALDLQSLQAQTEIQIAQQKQQAAYQAAKQQQDLNAQSLANAQMATFQSNLDNTLNLGLMILMIAICVSVAVIGINAGFGIYKILNVKAQAAKSSKPSIAVEKKLHRQPSITAQQARAQEKREREKQLQAKLISQMFKNSKAIWSSDDGKSEEFVPGNYPWAE